MKLARPNVFHPRIVLASGGVLPDGDADDAGLVGALRRRGLHARWLAWDDPQTEEADVVILRSVGDDPGDGTGEDTGEDTGDDTARREEFLAWTTRVANLLNPPAAIAWNGATRYLRDLAAAGIPVAASGTEAVSKHQAQAPGTTLIFLSGEQSHAFGTSAAGVLRGTEEDFELWDLGYAAVDVACAKAGITRTELLFARVDLIGGRRDPVVAELDLVAPDLGWRHLDDDTRALQQRRFALGVESACERMGLGPLSHRGP
jgi:hypothetical protein